MLIVCVDGVLGARRLLLARVEHGSPASQGGLNRLCERVRAPEHAPRNASSVLERRYGLAFIVERGAVGVEERHPVHQSHLERDLMTITENASCHGDYLARECLSFFETLQIMNVARRALEKNDEITLRMRAYYARVFYEDPAATLGDLRKAVTTLEELVPTTRRVFGGAHPLAMYFEKSLRRARAVLRAREE